MKKLNKDGFTLIELLAVIVVLAILITVSIPSVTKYLDSSRRDAFVIDITRAVEGVRLDVANTSVANEKLYSLAEINELLDIKLIKSPYGNQISNTSYIKAIIENDKPKFKVCIVDEKGNGIYNSYVIDKNLLVTNNPNDDFCHANDDIEVPSCTWSGPYSDNSFTTLITSSLGQSVTAYYELTCTDNVEIKTGISSANDILSSNNGILSNISITHTNNLENGYKYSISAVTQFGVGSAHLTLNSDKVKDNSGNGNIEVSSSNITVDKIWLYNAGAEYSSLTGGWSTISPRAWAYGGFSRKYDTYFWTNACGDGVMGVSDNLPNAGNFYTISKIDVTNFSRIIINSNHTTGGRVHFGLASRNNFSGWDAYAVGETGSGLSYKVEKGIESGNTILDVSQATGSYYLILAAWTPYDRGVDLYVYSIYAE